MKFTKATLTVTFAVSLAIANVTAAKLAFFDIPFVGGVAVPAGFLAIGVGFLCTDLISELYGKETARNVVNGTVVALVVAYGLIYSAIWMPVAPFYEVHSAYVTTLGSSANIVLASILTVLVSQNIDVSIFHHIAARTEIKAARNVGSTAVSQFVDTALFIVLGFLVFPFVFGGTLTPLATIPSLIIGQYVVKLVVALGDTPLFYFFSGLTTDSAVESV